MKELVVNRDAENMHHLEHYYFFCFLALALKYCDKETIKLIYHFSGGQPAGTLQLSRSGAKALCFSDFAKEAGWCTQYASDIDDVSDCYAASIFFNKSSEELASLTLNTQLAINVQLDTESHQLIVDTSYYRADVELGMERSLNYFIQHVEDRPNEQLAQWIQTFEEEWSQLDNAFQSPVREWGELINSNYVALFEKQVKATPKRIALQYQGCELTYLELNERANQMSYALSRHGIDHKDRIPVLSERSMNLVVAILAIWKIGAIYIPLDPEYPSSRIQAILEDCDPKLVLASASEMSNLDSCNWKVLSLQILECNNEIQTAYLDADYNSESIAYMIYTSGTTGMPKGVMIHHQGMINHLLCKIDVLGINEHTTIAQTASQCFDISIWQFFCALLVGGKTIIYDNETVLKVKPLLLELEKDRVQIVEFVPSYLQVLLRWTSRYPVSFSCLKYVLVTGEILKPKLTEQWFKQYENIPLVNAYGPTEASDDITHAILYKSPSNYVPIGKPVVNMKIYIVDNDMQVRPIGVKGEIIVTGVGVGPGYWNNAEKTDQSFVTLSIPTKEVPSRRFYLTGDIGCWTEDGDILYFGRKDDQVKIKGYRIELLDIDHAFSKINKVQDAVTIVEEQEHGDKRLVSYVLANEELSIERIKKQLSSYLPTYMIPEQIKFLAEFPLTMNGKVDKKALKSYGGRHHESGNHILVEEAY